MGCQECLETLITTIGSEHIILEVRRLVLWAFTGRIIDIQGTDDNALWPDNAPRTLDVKPKVSDDFGLVMACESGVLIPELKHLHVCGSARSPQRLIDQRPECLLNLVTQWLLQ